MKYSSPVFPLIHRAGWVCSWTVRGKAMGLTYAQSFESVKIVATEKKPFFLSKNI
jgi:hypothetical protein